MKKNEVMEIVPKKVTWIRVLGQASAYRLGAGLTFIHQKNKYIF